MPLALCPVSLKRTTVRRFFCLDLVSGLCSLCDRCCPTSSRHSVVVKNKRENDTLSLVVDFIAIRGKEELSPFVRSTVLLGPLLCALSSFFLLFLFDGAGHEEKKKGENKTSESIAALRFANLARPNSYLFTLFRFDVHKLVHCNRGEAIGQSRLGTRTAARHSSRFPSSRKNELVYAGEKKAEKKNTHCSSAQTPLNPRRRQTFATRSTRPLSSGP